MAQKFTKPISATDLRKLIDYQLPPRTKAALGGRHLVAFFHWDDQERGWMINCIEFHHPTFGRIEDGRTEILVLGTEDETTRYVGTPLLTYRGKPKVYKRLETLYRDLKAIAGTPSSVLLRESGDTVSEGPPDE